ncbi:GDSL-type esterase/lipase family protein [Paenibacillus sp. P26]|nr:GDSL-type esterase/lipase family protein [Paenibacillus sp. P26]
MGDSLAAGMTPTGGLDKSYADYLAASLQAAGYLTGYERRYAYPGYTTDNVLADLKANVTKSVYGSSEPDTVGIRGYAAQSNLITLDAGANDLLALVHRDTVTGGVYLVPSEVPPMLVKVQSNMAQILQELKTLNPSADIYVMGYYNPFPYLPAEVQAGLIPVLDQLNLTLQQTAAAAGAAFVPTKDVIGANRAAYIPNPSNIHLSLAGYQAVAGEFWKKVQQGALWKGGGSLTASDVYLRTAHLAWRPAADNVGVTGYRISDGDTVLATVYGNVYAYDLTGLRPGHAYTLKIEAGDAAGLWSTDGPSVSLRTKSDDDSPSSPVPPALRAQRAAVLPRGVQAPAHRTGRPDRNG